MPGKKHVGSLYRKSIGSEVEWENERRVKETFLDADLKHRVFRNCIFEGCNFTNAQLTGSKCIDCKWIKCNLSMVKWDGCRLQGNRFEECKIVGGNFAKCDPTFLSLSFKKCLINMGNFSDLKLKGISFAGSVVRETHFSNANLSEADFSECDLSGSLFHHADLSKANFVSAFNFSINPLNNKLKGTRFSKEMALSLLDYLGIVLE